MKTPTIALYATALTLVVPMTACSGPSSNCQAFSLSLASDTGGRASPLAAAQWYVAHAETPALPSTGWKETERNADGVNLTSGASSLHAIQGRDKKWQIDGGRSCQ